MDKETASEQIPILEEMERLIAEYQQILLELMNLLEGKSNSNS